MDPISVLIREFFYNFIVEHVLESGEYTQETLPIKIQAAIVACVKQILEQSKQLQDSIRVRGETVTEENCPAEYIELFATLLELKNQPLTSEKLRRLAQAVAGLESFKQMNPTQFLLEAAGITKVKPVVSNTITPAELRDAFYNEMAAQVIDAVHNDLLSRDDIEDQESNLYTALPALTIISALLTSQDVDGIRFSGKILTLENCPNVGIFQTLMQLVVTVKNKIAGLSADQIKVIQLVLSDKEIPPALTPLQNEALMQSTGVISNMSIEISREENFRKKIAEVLDFCSQSLKSGNQL